MSAPFDQARYERAVAELGNLEGVLARHKRGGPLMGLIEDRIEAKRRQVAELARALAAQGGQEP